MRTIYTLRACVRSCASVRSHKTIFRCKNCVCVAARTSLGHSSAQPNSPKVKKKLSKKFSMDFLSRSRSKRIQSINMLPGFRPTLSMMCEYQLDVEVVPISLRLCFCMFPHVCLHLRSYFWCVFLFLYLVFFLVLLLRFSASPLPRFRIHFCVFCS